MRIYSLIERATGEEIEADKTTVERLTGVEITYINWAIEQDGRFENGDWIGMISRAQLFSGADGFMGKANFPQQKISNNSAANLPERPSRKSSI